MRAKVTDFGMARQMSGHTKINLRMFNLAASHEEDEGTDTATAAAGTAQWMAPELCAVEVQISAMQQAIPKAGTCTPEQRQQSLEKFKQFQESHARTDYS